MIKNTNEASSGPIRFPASQTIGRLKEVTEKDREKRSANSTTLSTLRSASQTHVSIQSVRTMRTPIAQPSVMSSGSSSPLPATNKHKETVPNLLGLELGSAQTQMKADNNILSHATKESTAIMVATSTSITPDKKIDTMPILVDSSVPTLAKVKEEEQHIIAVSEKNNESNLLVLNTPKPTLISILLEETESTSSNPISINSGTNNQLTSRIDDRTKATENDNSRMDNYFNPFLATWQAWVDIYNEFAAIGIRLSINWFELLEGIDTNNCRN